MLKKLIEWALHNRVLIVLVALLGSRRTFTRVKLPLAARHIYLTGTEYILVGLCLGSQMLGLLDGKALQGLAPLLFATVGVQEAEAVALSLVVFLLNRGTGLVGGLVYLVSSVRDLWSGRGD